MPRVSLNSDGRSHPLLNTLAVFTLVVGVVSFTLGLVLVNAPSVGHAAAVTAAVTGLVCLLVGLYAQMMSATREQRILIVTGMIGGFVGLALGLAHGGFGGLAGESSALNSGHAHRRAFPQ